MSTGAWSAAVANWAELQGVHTDGNNPDVDTSDLPPVDCVFEFEPRNDYVLLLDRSFSMSTFENSGTGLNAFDNARQGAVGLYNQVPTNAESAAVYTYNTNVQKPVPYVPRTAVIEEDGPELGGIAPAGNTDICKAIRAAADDIKAENPGAGQGNAVLLSDGLPTVASCDSDAEVLDAAQYACSRPVPVRVHTLAYGAADDALLLQVAQTCGATSFAASSSTGSFVVAPEHLKFELARLGTQARGYQEVLNQQRLLGTAQQESLVVPAATAELNVAWVGDGYERTLTVGGAGAECSFRQLQFSLESPSGVVHLPAPNATALGAAERDVQFVRVRVTQPEPGLWRMKLAGDAYLCHTPQGELGDPTSGHRPRLSWQAGIRHHTLRAVAEATPSTAPRDTPIRITAVLRFPEPWRAAPLHVQGTVRHQGTASALPFRDDGLDGDAKAGDGLYTGVFNPAGALRAPGFYEVSVRLLTNPGLTRGVVAERESMEAGPSGASASMPVLGAADVIARTTFVLENCCNKAQGTVCQACRSGACATVARHQTLERGKRYTQLSLTTNQFASATQGASLGLGQGVRVSNLRVQPAGATGKGKVVFDAAVDPATPVGPRVATLQDRHRRCLGSPGDFTIR